MNAFNGNLGCFQLMAIMNSAAVNIYLYDSYKFWANMFSILLIMYLAVPFLGYFWALLNPKVHVSPLPCKLISMADRGNTVHQGSQKPKEVMKTRMKEKGSSARSNILLFPKCH